MKNYKRQFEDIFSQLVSSEVSDLSAFTALKPIFTEIQKELEAQGIILDTTEKKDHGAMIVSQRAAVACIDDYHRTITFLRGIYCGILSKFKSMRQSETLRILYAGCGPFASLMLPFMAIFDPRFVVVSLMDINPLSIDVVKKVMQITGFESSVDQYIVADASTYQIPDPQPSIVISETMNVGLVHEALPAIYCNLKRQLGDSVLFIPEDVTLSVVKNSRQWVEHIGQFISLQELPRLCNSDNGLLPVLSSDFAVYLDIADQVSLRTTVHVCGKHLLSPNSGRVLTTPIPLRLQKHGRVRFQVRYQPGVASNSIYNLHEILI